MEFKTNVLWGNPKLYKYFLLKFKRTLEQKRARIYVAIDGYNYFLRHQFKNGNKYYSCKNTHSERCPGRVTLSPNGSIVRRRRHTCGDNDEPIEEIQEYEEIGKKLKINGHSYNFSRKHMSGNKYYMCVNCYREKCHGSITMDENLKMVKMVKHSCSKASQEKRWVIRKIINYQIGHQESWVKNAPWKMLCDSSGESKNLLNVYLICLILDFLFLNKITNKQISTDFLEHF